MGIDHIGQNQNATVDPNSTFAQSVDAAANEGVENNTGDGDPTVNVLMPPPGYLDNLANALNNNGDKNRYDPPAYYDPKCDCIIITINGIISQIGRP